MTDLVLTPEAFARDLEDLVKLFGRKLNDNEVIAALEAQLDRAFADACEPGLAALRQEWMLAQEGFTHPIHQVALRAGFLICREYMARFVEQGGDTSTAASIRANWSPALGEDPGLPRRYRFSEVAEAEDMENGPWRSKDPGLHLDAAVYAFCAMHQFGMKTPPEPGADEAAATVPA
jgi:hypothetical protein